MDPFFDTQVKQNVLQKSTDRQFPGPAGILPLLTSKEMGNILRDLVKKGSKKTNCFLPVPETKSSASKEESKRDFEKESRELGSNLNLATIDKKPWKVLRNYLNLKQEDAGEALISLLSKLSMISDLIKVQEELNQKRRSITVPFMLVVVQQDVSVRRLDRGSFAGHCNTLCMDPTGVYEFWFTPGVMKQLGYELKSGTTLALRNCTAFKIASKYLLLVDGNTVLYRASSMSEWDEDTEEDNQDDLKTPPCFPKTVVKEESVSVVQYHEI